MRNALVFLVSALLLVVAGSAWIVLYPSVPADLGGVESLESQAKHVRIPVGEDDTLDGWYLPGSRHATIVLFPGYARDHRRMWRYATFLRREGYNLLTIDFRSARTLKRKPTTLGFWELRDARATLDWLRARPELRGQRFGLFGESLGGVTALALAAERPDIAAVVVDCPFASGDAAIGDGLRFVAHMPAYPFGPLARQVGRLVTGHDPGEFDATASLRALNGRPVLLIQTKVEDRFSHAQVERLTTAAGLRAETWTVEDAKHTEIWVSYRDEYEKRVSRFFDQHLGGRPVPPPGARVVKGAKAGTKAVTSGAKAVGKAIAKPFQKKSNN